MTINRHNPVLASGTTATTSAVPASVVVETGLRKVAGGSSGAGVLGASAPSNGVVFTVVENSPVDGSITIYAWKHTSTSNPTLIAATGAVTNIAWHCFGD